MPYLSSPLLPVPFSTSGGRTHWRRIAALFLAASTSLACSDSEDDSGSGSESGGAGGGGGEMAAGAGGDVAGQGGSSAGGVGASGGDGGTTGGTFKPCPEDPSGDDLLRCTSGLEPGQLGSGPAFDEIASGAVDAANNRLIVLAHSPADELDIVVSVYAIDLTTGDRTLLSGGNPTDGTLGEGDQLYDSAEVAVAPDGSIYVNTRDELYRIDEATGDRVLAKDLDASMDACKFVSSAFSIDSEGLFHFTYHSASEKYGRGWLRYDLSEDNCEAYSRCAGTSTPLGEYGDGPCVSSPKSARPYDGYVWSTDHVTQSLVKVDLATGDRVRVSRAVDDATGVGSGDACMRVGGEIAALNANIWLTGNTTAGGCAEGDVTMTAIDPTTGDRSVVDASNGPLTGAAGSRVQLVWKHPTLDALLVSADAGVALFNPENGDSAYLSR